MYSIIRPSIALAALFSLVLGGCSYGTKTEAPPPAEPPAPRPAPVAQPAPEPPPKIEKIVLDGDVLFDFDKAVLKPAARDTLDNAIRVMRAHPEVSAFRLQGHTDSVGSDAYNQRLSERRVNAVRDYLVRGGIPASKLQTRAFGESRPVADNGTDAGRARNRRVEIEPIVAQ